MFTLVGQISVNSPVKPPQHQHIKCSCSMCAGELDNAPVRRRVRQQMHTAIAAGSTAHCEQPQHKYSKQNKTNTKRNKKL